jgi:hypothetical protein
VAECKPSANSFTTAEVFVAAMLSAMTSLPPLGLAKLEELKHQVITSAAKAVEDSAQTARQRKPIPELAIGSGEGDAGDDPTKLKGAIDKVLAPMKMNAALDREELDLLWWALSDWSSLADMRVSSMSPATCLLAASLETVDRLRRIPATAHAHVALVKFSGSQPLPFEDLVVAATELKPRVMSSMDYLTKGIAYPRIFPLVASLFGSATSGFEGQAMDPLAWCKKLMLEAGTLRLAKAVSV